MMQKSGTFTTIFHVKKCYFHYDFACKKVPLYDMQKNIFFRQSLRENCHELRELESKLRTAYVAKELATQLAEKNAKKLEDKVISPFCLDT
jgi:hypothetical protein